MRERRLRFVVEQLAGGDEVTCDQVGVRRGQAAQLVSYLLRQVTRADVLRQRRRQIQAWAVRPVVAAPVAAGRSARSTVAILTETSVIPRTPVIPGAGSTITVVAPLAVATETALVTISTAAVARVPALTPVTGAGLALLADPLFLRARTGNVTRRLVHGALCRAGGSSFSRLLAGQRPRLADATGRRGVVEVDGKVVVRPWGRRLSGRAAPSVLGARTVLTALVPGLTRSAFLAVSAPPLVAVTKPTVPVSGAPALITVGATAVAAPVVPALRPSPTVLKTRTVAAVSTVPARRGAPVPVAIAWTIIAVAVPPSRTAALGTAAFIATPV
jgi:hypothetical protein